MGGYGASCGGHGRPQGLHHKHKRARRATAEDPAPGAPGVSKRTLRTVPRVNYSQVKRRGPQKGKDNTGRVESAYMEPSSSKGGARMTLGKTIETGEAVLDRITRERYEWRDGAYAKTRPIVYDDGG